MQVEQRDGNRRVLRVRAAVEIDGALTQVRTHDISVGGISLLLPFPCRSGAIAKVQFGLFHEGKMHQVGLSCKAVHCTLSADEFRTGFAFTVVSPDSQKLITAYCNVR